LFYKKELSLDTVRFWIHIIFLAIAGQTLGSITDTSGIRKLVAESHSAFLQKNFNESIGLAMQAIGAAEKIKFAAALGDAYLVKALSETRVNQLDSAQKDLLRSYGYYKVAGNKRGASEAIDGLSGIYYWRGDAYKGQIVDTLNGRKLKYMQMDQVFFFSIYMGALLFCMIYNLFLYRFSKDRAYLELAKCIGAYLFFIYNTNYDFATQFDRNMVHLTIMNCLKNYSIMFGTFFFASFIEQLLQSRKNDLERFYKFIAAYKKVLKVWIALCTLQIVLVILTKYNDPYWYFQHLLLWFAVVDLSGLALTILIFVMLFIHSSRNKVRINYLILGFVLNIACMIISVSQAVTDSAWSRIPYPAALGSVFFLICMTVAITDKITTLRKEKEEAQSNALKHLEGLVAERTRDLKHQKELIEEKQTQILDSINYARRLQNAILTTDRTMQAIFRESFVMYKPKDIVSGDFYWMLHIEDQKKDKNIFIMAAADCTGHGVPGAFMSMLNSTLLNQTAYNPNINTPSDALNFLNVELPKNLRSVNDNENINDGMDIAFCLIDLNRNKMKYAGANNPCWIIRNDELIELKPLKQAITAATGYEKKPFVDQEIELQKNDSIYLFTDGYADQFGGPNGKKFKYKTLGQLLLKIHNDPCEKQKEILETTFMDWKGNLEQVDDVCIIGIRI
jgi:serine phosphatase RsbU (regulator of sigma subunit)